MKKDFQEKGAIILKRNEKRVVRNSEAKYIGGVHPRAFESEADGVLAVENGDGGEGLVF